VRLSPWLASRRPLLIPLLAGACLPMAYAPIGLYPVALITVAVFFAHLLAGSPRQGFWRGYLFGVGFFGVGVSWVAVSMYRFGAMGALLSGLATLLFVLFLALFPALMGWLNRRYFARLPMAVQLLLPLPALWVLLEWVRGWIMTGFPWLLLGYSQTDSPLAGLAPITGVYGLSWVMALSAGFLVLAWRWKGRRRLIPLAAWAVLWGLSGLLSLVQWSEPAGEPFTASLIQGNVPQNLKWRPEQRQPTIELYTRLTRENWSSRLVLWPETALPAYYHQAHNFLAGLAREGAEQGSELVLGLPVMADPETGRYYNSVVRAGETPLFYHKRHLVPFGEYIPLKSILGTLLDILRVPMANFSRGEPHQPLLPVAGHKAGVSICYEDAFGEEVIEGLPEAELLINVSNDAWFGDSFAPHQHLQMARMRAMETARPMLRATNNGVSAIMDYRGQLTAISPQFRVYVLKGEVQARHGATPYALVGNYPVISLLFLILAAAVFWNRQKIQ
jgi:apolipoprotein N-acyltransferase